MKKQLGLFCLLLLCVVETAPAQGVALEEIVSGKSRKVVDLFMPVTATDVPEAWFVNEGSDPNPRPVAAERFVRFQGSLPWNVFNPAVRTPFDFRMYFMDGVEHRVVIESVVEVTRGAVTLRHATGRVKSDRLSRINLVLSEEQIQGTVHFDDAVIEFRPVIDDISVIQLLDAQRFPKERKPKPAHRQPGFIKKEPPTGTMKPMSGGSFLMNPGWRCAGFGFRSFGNRCASSTWITDISSITGLNSITASSKCTVP